jgi:hypothetical protein
MSNELLETALAELDGAGIPRSTDRAWQARQTSMARRRRVADGLDLEIAEQLSRRARGAR